MTTKNVETLACVHVPKSTCMVVAAADDTVPAYVQRAHTVFMSNKYPQQATPLDIPNAQCTVARARYGDGPVVEYLETADRRAVPRESIDAVPGFDVPDAEILVAATAHDQGVRLAPTL